MSAHYKKRTFYNTSLFSLLIEQEDYTTRITMKVHSPILNTRFLPNTYSLLEKHLPSILRSKCFNDENLPFSQEVKRTEVGHLFEHVLLEFLCQHKISLGIRDALYNGVTHWDWEEDEQGVFHITIDSGYNDAPIFKPALEKSAKLLSLLYLNRQA